MGHVISESPVTGLSSGGHLGQKRFGGIDVVIDHDPPLGRMQPVKPARILCEGSAPGYGHGEEQRIEACVVKALSEVAAARHYDALLAVRHGLQGLDHLLALL